MIAPKVSVCMVVYNHELFVAEAIESVLTQKANFAIELIIGEDCSTDSTRHVIEKYQKENPDKIRVITSENNVGAQPNFVRTYEACRGKYIAVLEGDDYWTDPCKLQVQVDFLDQHPDYAICCHNGIIVEGDSPNAVGILYDPLKFNPLDTGTIFDLAKGNYLSTLTCMSRNIFGPLATPHRPFPDWFSKLGIGDYSLHLLTARFGYIKYLPLTMAAYRVHPGGAWSMQSELNRAIKMYDSLQLAKVEFNSEVRAGLERQQRQHLASIAELGKSNADFDFERFLIERKEGIPGVIADEIVPLVQEYFKGHHTVVSAEYRATVKMMRPLRWAVNWLRAYRRK